jgi:HrpA-like RNA helicase
VGRMILAAVDNVCLTEMLIIASALSVQDPRDRPMEYQQQADEKHKKFADEKSEFLSFLKIWRWFEQAIEHIASCRTTAARTSCRRCACASGATSTPSSSRSSGSRAGA